MPLYQRPDSPCWWVTIGDDVRESTKVRHEGKKKPPQAAREYERLRAERYWREQHLGQRVVLSFRAAADAWLSCDSKPRKRDRECLAWLMDKPAPEAPQLGVHPVTDVKQHDALDGIRKLALAKGWSHSTVDRHMATLSAVLNHAHSPMGALPEPVVVPLYRDPTAEPRWLTREEFGALAAELPYHLRLAAAFAVVSMLRMRAMLRLQWSRIDRANKVAYIPKRDQKGQRKTFKFPLSSDALALLDSLRELNPKGAWVFQWNGKPIDDCNTAAFQAAMARAGIADANWHTLRHTGATWARQAGAADGVLMDLGDWSDIRMVRRYAHHGPVPAHVHAASEAISSGALAALVCSPKGDGGARGDRTPDLDIANVALSQLSYCPDPEPSRTDADLQNPHVVGSGLAIGTPETPLSLNVLAFRARDTSVALRMPPLAKKSKS
jgi:integrase